MFMVYCLMLKYRYAFGPSQPDEAILMKLTQMPLQTMTWWVHLLHFFNAGAPQLITVIPNTMAFINVSLNSCKTHEVMQRIKNSSNIRLPDGLKHRPHIWCTAALLMMGCCKSTCGLTCLMSQGQLHYFKSWDWDAAPYEFLSGTM